MVDWPGLFAWSTKYHDGTKTSEFKMMTDEDREFLQKAMEEAFGKIEDPNQVMAEAIGQIKATDRTDASITTALEVIDKCCDDPDCARNCEKLDGLQPLLDLLETHRGSIGLRTCEILALLFSNNPNIQKAGASRSAMEILLRIVKDSDAGSETRSKAFRAVVALVRQVEAFEEKFLRENDGIKIIISCADQSDLRLCEKASSFIRSLAQDGRLKAEDVAALAAALVPLMTNIENGQIQYRETLSSCICELARVAPESCPPELKAAAQERLKLLLSTEEFDDSEKASLQEFISLLPSS
jgi:hypothetical protein